MRVIKTLVVILTLLLVSGLGLLGYMLYSKASLVAKGSASSGLSAPQADYAPPAPSGGGGALSQAQGGDSRKIVFGNLSLRLPQNAQVRQILAVGETLVLAIQSEQSGPQLIVLDPASGRELGRINMVPDGP